MRLIPGRPPGLSHGSSVDVPFQFIRPIFGPPRNTKAVRVWVGGGGGGYSECHRPSGLQ